MFGVCLRNTWNQPQTTPQPGTLIRNGITPYSELVRSPWDDAHTNERLSETKGISHSVPAAYNKGSVCSVSWEVVWGCSGVFWGEKTNRYRTWELLILTNKNILLKIWSNSEGSFLFDSGWIGPVTFPRTLGYYPNNFPDLPETLSQPKMPK